MKYLFLCGSFSGLHIIILVIICKQRSCFGQIVYSNGEDNKGKEPKFTEKLTKQLDHNVITSEITPWQIVAPNEAGFDLNEQEIVKLKIWPLGIIPYYIDSYSFDKTMSSRLQRILNAVNSITGLRFTELPQPPKSEDERWVFFVNRRSALACEDYTTKSFTNKGVQRVVVGYDCVREGGGLLAPIILTLVGVPPQHNSPDRDKYVTVNMDNVLPDKKHLFEKVKENEWLFYDLKYDFLSAGHYDFHRYSVNGSATIVPKFKVRAAVGEGDGFSYNDIWKIKMLYNFIRANTPYTKTSDCSNLFKIKKNKNTKQLSGKQNTKPRKMPERYLNNKGPDQNPNEVSDDEHDKLKFKKTRDFRDALEAMEDVNTTD